MKTVKEVLERSDSLNHTYEPDGLMFGMFTWIIVFIFSMFSVGVRSFLVFLEENILMGFISPLILFSVIGQIIFVHMCKRKTGHFAKVFGELCGSEEFVESFKKEVARAISERKRVYRVTGTRTISTTGTEDKIVIGSNLVEPEHSIQEGRLAHLFRILPDEVSQMLESKVPQIKDLAISSVASPTPGEPFGSKELR
ncbi:MAG: hypothetical protein KBC21_01055 [Candidatus Pacebacteria bacterium]|nr:hypothetical protein [Candidatus Paceibacterota bacterium]